MAKQFLKECKETRDAFVKIAGTYKISDNLELRTEIDSLLIMYDQLCERVRLANVDTGENNALLPDVSGCFYNHKPTGIKGTLIKRYKPTGRPETILIDTFDNDVYFAPAHEFELVNNR